jgi:hypothetical protein
MFQGGKCFSDQRDWREAPYPPSKRMLILPSFSWFEEIQKIIGHFFIYSVGYSSFPANYEKKAELETFEICYGDVFFTDFMYINNKQNLYKKIEMYRI